MQTKDSAPTDWLDRALARWPGVPATYGWLSLDARGRWCLQGAAATHDGLRRFLSQHFREDARGAWYVQNGPQQVYVDLATAPHVARGIVTDVLRHRVPRRKAATPPKSRPPPSAPCCRSDSSKPEECSWWGDVELHVDLHVHEVFRLLAGFLS